MFLKRPVSIRKSMNKIFDVPSNITPQASQGEKFLSRIVQKNKYLHVKDPYLTQGREKVRFYLLKF